MSSADEPTPAPQMEPDDFAKGSSAPVGAAAEEAVNADLAADPDHSGSSHNSSNAMGEERSQGHPHCRSVVVVRTRTSTPERIRRHTRQLYQEVHELIDRQHTRSDRQKDIARRASSRSSVVGKSSIKTEGDSSIAVAAPANGTTQLPDLYRTFEESRCRHLREAQNMKPYFPSVLQPSEFSERNPATFSLRFQASHIDEQGPTDTWHMRRTE